MRFRPLALLALAALAAARDARAIWRQPTGVNVNAQSATTVFITFGALSDQVPVEAIWCRVLVPAAPDVGTKCDPSTVLGRLPLRFDQSRQKQSLFYDVMTIPPSVARQAFQAAEAGENGTFFYVRRFRSTRGGPDEFVPVTCRLTGGGARVPLALTEVRLGFASEQPVATVETGGRLPPIEATISYNGTGQLRGRWEVVFPGEEPPSSRDLLTEGTLPPTERGTQRRYTLVDRFSVFLPPSSRAVTLPVPDPARLPSVAGGLHLVLLRIEATDEREGISSLEQAGATEQGLIPTGGVAGFPLPVLRYFVGSAPAGASARGFVLLAPEPGASTAAGAPLVFTWNAAPGASMYRLEVETEAGAELLSATVKPGAESYRAPSWLAEKAAGGALRWRVKVLDADGRVAGVSETRAFRFLPPGGAP